ncbi:MAG: hypothetical protein KDC98_01075 [Planctomycetes bacterium]|nr:hypothetical protein [Planctomycetota bacterium]
MTNRRSRARAAALAFLLLPACTSLWEQRDYQAVEWADGDGSRIEVWLRQGTEWAGVPWLTILDVLATPVLWIADVQFASAALAKDDARISGGPVGFLVSLLPFFTCMPIDARPSAWLHLDDPLRLPAEEREQLRRMGERGGVRWLARHYQTAFPDSAASAEKVRTWVTGVRLVPAAAAKDR